MFDATGPRANTSQDMIDWSVDVEPSSLVSVASPFIPDDCEDFDITLPPKGVPIGMTLATDEDYLAPFLVWVDPGKPVYREIPLRHHFCKSWITWIHNEKPIRRKGAQEILRNLQRDTEQCYLH